MSNTNLLLILLVLCILIFICTYLCLICKKQHESFIDISTLHGAKWNRGGNRSCKNRIIRVIKAVLDDCDMKNDKIGNTKISDFYFPCGYNNINREIKLLPKTKNGRYFIIDGADEISAKDRLWSHILQHHGHNKAKSMSPDTFVFSKKGDLDRLEKSHVPGTVYMMKKNIQRQRGLHITDNVDYIKKKHKGYVLAQVLLQDPYTINGRKINLRVYVLVVCHRGKMDVYVYKDGFMYYTKQKYIPGDISRDNHITTGYIDRKVYDENPLTHEDFRQYLDSTRDCLPCETKIKNEGKNISDITFNRIYDLIKDIFMSFKGYICNKKNKFYDNVTYQLFGADVSINNKLHPHIMEINKGPDLGAKDERDKAVKFGLVKDMFRIMGGAERGLNNKFLQVLEVTGCGGK